jgi:hypothetical protein
LSIARPSYPHETLPAPWLEARVQESELPQ